MKISKLFHWLYFIVMMLPIFSIPIFAIYSHRHTIDNYSVIREEPNFKNVFQYIENGRPNSIDTYSVDSVGATLNYSNNNYLYFYPLYEDEAYYIDIRSNGVADFTEGHNLFYSLELAIDSTHDTYLNLYFDYNDFYHDEDILCINSDGDVVFYKYFGSLVPEDSTPLFNTLSINVNSEYYFEGYLKNIMVFDLTDIFGSGNEPSAEMFNSYLVNSYYNFGDNLIELGTHNVTYSDTDIGSQFTYDMYNVVDKYFNYDRVFNFGDLYGWLNTTFFSGNAPLGFFIFWHLLIYWLLTSILWLIFDVLMYVPQLVHRWLDKASIS